LAAAKEKQRHCLEKRWRVTFAGREFILKEEADRVIRWLNRVKEVGDVVVNVDPMHAGLPWAGIRLLLEVRVLCPEPKALRPDVSVDRLLYLRRTRCHPYWLDVRLPFTWQIDSRRTWSSCRGCPRR
jgi:hypothetical protein